MVVNTVTKPNSKTDSGNVANNVFVNVPPRAAPERPELKGWSALKILIRLQLVLAVLIIVFESIKFGVITNILQLRAFGTFTFGTGWWVGLFGVITAGLGFGAFRTSRGNKCLMIGHFVMGVVTIVADGVLIIFTSIFLSQWRDRFGYYYYNSGDARGEVTDATSFDTNYKGLTANESLMLIAVVTHFVSSIVSSAFICRNMCGGAQPPITLVYVPPGATDGHEQANNTGGITCQVKPGAQVFFMPNAGATRQQNDFSPAVQSS